MMHQIWLTAGDQHPQEGPAGDTVSVNHQILPLNLNDYGVHDRTNIHDFPHLIFRTAKSEISDNSKSLLVYTKCMLNILPASLLALSKPTSCPHNRV
jgi:hypothetical protein